MAIRNPDGSIYSPAGTLATFDPNNPEFDLFNTLDQEAIEIGGTPIYYYELFVQSNTIDPIYLEDRGKIWATEPICLFGLFNQPAAQNLMSTFGIDSPDELLIEFNYKDVLQRIGHPPKIGSRLFTPFKKENWKIVQLIPGDSKLYFAGRLNVFCQRFQEDLVTGAGRPTPKDLNIDFNSFVGLK